MESQMKFLSDDNSDNLSLGKETKEDHYKNDDSSSLSDTVTFSNCKTNKEHTHNVRLIFLCICALLVVVICFAIVSYVKLRSCEESGQKVEEVPNVCLYSDEAARVGLRKFLERVRDEYFQVCPEDIAWHPESTYQMVREKFQIHNPKPEHIKRVSDRAESLYREAIDLKPDLTKLKPREHKAYLQMIHFLQFNFGKPSSLYKSGLWLLGPSSFCEEPMCYLSSNIHNSFYAFRPKEKKDIDEMIVHFRNINQSVHDYMDVLKMGIAKGMVRTRRECMAGFHTFKSLHMEISQKGAAGIKEQRYAMQFYRPEYYKGVLEEVEEVYRTQHGVNVSKYVAEKVEQLIGKPIHLLLTFLEGEYYDACRPDNIGPGGLSALPLDFVYYNESVVPNSKTHPYLPMCNASKCRLNGSEAYAMIIGYYTTKDIHPLEVNRMGWENVQRIYPQMVDIAKRVSKLSNETEAMRSFRSILSNLSLSYFNTEPIPANQSNEQAFLKCTSDETAKRYCPKRWEALMEWFRFSNMAMSMHEGNTVDFFFFTGKRKTTPSCPVKLRADYNPSSGAQSYWESDYNCTAPSKYFIPFFLENLGPKYSEYTVNAHEARPGHHTQVQGMTENFFDSCEGPERFLQGFTYYTAFSEGWALYAESPLISDGTDVYENNLMQKYGMLKWQMWRAIRLIVDTGLHYKGYSREKSLNLFDKYAWDNTDMGRKEITRYQSNPGQATAYMIGQLDIWRLRNHTQDQLQDLFSLKEFHLQTISQGASPLAFLESHINKYIACKLGTSEQYCDVVLNPADHAKASESQRRVRRRDSEVKIESPRRNRHHL